MLDLSNIHRALCLFELPIVRVILQAFDTPMWHACSGTVLPTVACSRLRRSVRSKSKKERERAAAAAKAALNEYNESTVEECVVRPGCVALFAFRLFSCFY